MALFRPLLREHQLTEQQWRVIRVLAANKTMDVSALADETVLLAPSLSRILSTLTQAGLVERTPDAQDQRRALLSLTKAGTRLFQTISPYSETIYQQIEDQFGQAELDTLQKLLHKLEDTLNTLEANQ